MTEYKTPPRPNPPPSKPQPQEPSRKHEGSVPNKPINVTNTRPPPPPKKR